MQKSNLGFPDTGSDSHHVVLSSAANTIAPVCGCLLGARHFTCMMSFIPTPFHLRDVQWSGQHVAEVAGTAHTFLGLQRSELPLEGGTSHFGGFALFLEN